MAENGGGFARIKEEFLVQVDEQQQQQQQQVEVVDCLIG
jgi:hypothetical protein